MNYANCLSVLLAAVALAGCKSVPSSKASLKEDEGLPVSATAGGSIPFEFGRDSAGIATVLGPWGTAVFACPREEVTAEDVKSIAFPWKGYPDFKTPCRQTVQGLRFLVGHAQRGMKVYFHCTVGEDRTGELAGLYRMLAEGLDASTAFHGELCEGGYSAGNPQKPYNGVKLTRT